MMTTTERAEHPPLLGLPGDPARDVGEVVREVEGRRKKGG